ncbi:PadR family transcriptional regulator [Micromonospora sp. LZ34]
MDSDRRGQWLRGVLDLCVLALLCEGESYGYQIAQALDAAGVGPIQGGTLYPVLLRLQRTGLVTAQWREGAAGPARKYYRLTDSGRAALRQDGRAWLAFVAPVSGIVTKGVDG